MTTLQSPVAELLQEAANWRLIGLLFECPSEAWRERVEELAREASDPELKIAAAQSREGASEGLYHSTFGPGGPAPPREATHRDTVELGHFMSELAAYYTAFGYSPAHVEPPDHIAVEAGFLAFLKLKEAFALNCGDAEAAQIAHDAAAGFLSEHVASTAAPLAAVLAASRVPYLESVGRALARHAGPAKRRFLILGPENLDRNGDLFGCGQPE